MFAIPVNHISGYEIRDMEQAVAARPVAPCESEARIDICIPMYRHNPSELIRDLARQRSAANTTLTVYDDGSCDPALTQAVTAALAEYPGRAHLIGETTNLGRSQARNALIAAAESDWLLFLDSDMRIPGHDFLTLYRRAAAQQRHPCCIVGGFGVDPDSVTPGNRLHALQSIRSECVDAADRNRDPGRYVFTSNIFLHRKLYAEVPFDSRFNGWGWEDVEWGLRLAQAFPVLHIENRAMHLGLDEDVTLLNKYENSAQNFMRMLESHPDSVKRMPVYRMANHLTHLPALRALIWATRRAALSHNRTIPNRVRLLALKLFRVSVYARALNAASS